MMMRFALSYCRSSRRAVVMTWVVLLALWACAGLRQAQADVGPFAGLTGRWSGSGIIRQQGGKTERIRCNANYRPLGSTQHEVNVQLSCNSDSYHFDLDSQYQADENNRISGRWTERSRNIGGIGIGYVRGSRIQIHIETSAFSATLHMVTRGSRQSVTIDSQGGGEIANVSLTLHRH
jgi:hypothetical protein